MAKLVFDENVLTIGDLEDFEDACGLELQDALKPVPVKDDEGNVVRGEDGRPEMTVSIKPKVLKALVWIANRHDNPEFSLTDARDTRVTELEIIREDEGDNAEEVADPKE